jgi:hypothetical protein
MDGQGHAREPMAMQHFQLIRSVDTAAIRAEVEAHSPLWFAQTGRQARSPAQKETFGIPLRGLRHSKVRGRRRRDVHESRYTTLSRQFPATVRLLEQLATELGGELGRAKLARLPPGRKVRRHLDRGDYYRHRDRYHVVIVSPAGSPLEAGGEQVRMREGELWWFDNGTAHAARNDGSDDRVHLIFDLLPKGPKVARPRGATPQVVLAGLTATAEHREAEAVAAAARLYLAARDRPRQWQALLELHGLAARADRSPLGAVARLCWPELRTRARRRRESALAWCLAELDTGRRQPDDLAAALLAAGGIETVHALWRSDRTALLYGGG